MESIFASRPSVIATTLLLLCNAFLFLKITRSWTTPPVVVSLAWFLFAFIPCLFMWDVPINPLAVLFIFACVFSFSAGSLAFEWNGLHRKTGFEPNFSDPWTMAAFMMLASTASLSVLPHLLAQGISPWEFKQNLLAAAGKYMSMKYAGQINPTLYFPMGTLSNYLCVMLGGLIFGTALRLRVRITVIVFSFLPSILFLMLYGDKGTIFLSVALFYGGLVAISVMRGVPQLLTKRRAKILVSLAPFLAVAILIALAARGMKTSDSKTLQSQLSFALRSYAFGHFFAYSDWFSSILGSWGAQNYVHYPTPTGYLTFLAPMKNLGIRSFLPDGFYDEYLLYPGVVQTNIYTVFRGLIQDFGLIGASIVSFVAGLVSSTLYVLLVRFPKSGMLVTAYVMLFGFIYTSYLISLSVWTSPLVAAIVLAIGLHLRNKIGVGNVAK